MINPYSLVLFSYNLEQHNASTRRIPKADIRLRRDMLSIWLKQHVVAMISVGVTVVIFFVGIASNNIASAIVLENRVTIIEQGVVALNNTQKLYNETTNKHTQAITELGGATNKVNITLAENTLVLEYMSSVIGKLEKDKEVLSDLKTDTAVISNKVEEIQRTLDRRK